MRKRTILYLSALAVTLSLVALSSSASWGEGAPANTEFAYLPFLSNPSIDIYVGDFDGDGRDDLGVFRSKDSSFDVLLSTGKRFGAEDSGQWVAPNQFGNADGKYYIGDYNGDDKFDLGFYEPANSSFYVSLSNGESFGAIGSGQWLAPGEFGHQNGRYYVAYFNGGKRSDLGFFDPTDNSFWVSLSTGSRLNGEHSGKWVDPDDVAFGHAGGRYYTGDFNNDGSDDLGFFEPGDSSFHISKSNGVDEFPPDDRGRWIEPGGFGNPGGQYFVGDFTGDGKADLGYFEPAGAYANTFWVARSNGADFPPKQRTRWVDSGEFGHSGGQYFIGNFNGGTGKVDLAFYDPATGDFHVGLSNGADGFDFSGSGVWANIK
jgi:hypothetical protein